MAKFNPPKPPAQPQRFDGIDPLDGRYYDSEVARYFSEEARVYYQAVVEAALARTLTEFNICDPSVADEIEKAAQAIKAEEIAEAEKTTKHDVRALVNVLRSKVSDKAKPFVHLTATSYDIVDTARSLQFRQGLTAVMLPRFSELIAALLKLTNKYADTVQIGRTHGQHGVPITFGFAIAQYIERIGSTVENINALSEKLMGKFSGAMGSYNALGLFVSDPLDFEAKLLQKLDLKPAPISTQIVPPEPILRILDELTLLSGAMANLATDIRQLQRTEIAEVRERFEEGQVGSSTMAHKRNPVSFENVVSLHKEVIGQNVTSKLNLISEHQRDLTDSASGRFYPVLVATVAEMAKRMANLMDKLEIDEAAMKRNLELTHGAIAAEPLYLLLSKYGHPDAHTKAKELAQFAQDSGQDLGYALAQDEDLKSYLPKFAPFEQKIIAKPELHYTGRAADQARRIASKWQAAK